MAHVKFQSYRLLSLSCGMYRQIILVLYFYLVHPLILDFVMVAENIYFSILLQPVLISPGLRNNSWPKSGCVVHVVGEGNLARAASTSSLIRHLTTCFHSQAREMFEIQEQYCSLMLMRTKQGVACSTSSFLK